MTDVVTLSGGVDGHSVSVTVTGSHAFSLAEQYAGIITGGSASGEFTTTTGTTFTGTTGTETVATLLDQGAGFFQDPVSGTFTASGVGASTIFGGADAIFDLSGTSSVVAGVGDTITASADVTLLGGAGFTETGSVSLTFVGSLGASTVMSGGSAAVLFGSHPSVVTAAVGNDTLLGANVAAGASALDKVVSAASSVVAGYSSGSITISDFGSAASSLVALYGHSVETAATALATNVATGGSHTINLADKSSITFSNISHLKDFH